MSDRYLVWDGKTYPIPTPSPGPIDPPVDPPPPPGDVTATTAVVVGRAQHDVSGVNIPRGVDDLIVYARPATATGTNRWGVEVTVLAGIVTSVRDREASGVGQDVATPVPAGGFVLSGHRASRVWLLANATVGTPVALVAGEPVPPTASGKTLAVYLMDGVGHVAQIPQQCTQTRVAFLQGTKLVEWGGDTPAQTAAGLTTWRTGRRQTLVSVGGQGGAVTMGGIVGAFHDIEHTAPSFPVNGPDWDVEKSSLDVAQCVAVSKELAAGRGDSWVTSFVPSGGDPVAINLDAARQCQKAGLRVQFGQQLYDTRIDLDAVIRQTKLAVDVLGQESVLVGCMVGVDPAKYSTVDQWVQYVGAVVDKWPDIGGAYVWESSRPGTGEWARRVGAVLGISA